MATQQTEQLFDRLILKASRYLPLEGLDELRRAYEFSLSSDTRAPQIRFSGEPSVNHYLSVAERLVDWRLDSHTVCAGMLHDIIEDPKIHALQLRATFQDDVTFLVESVTKLNKFEQSGDVEANVEYFLKMFLAASSDIRVPIIKLADRCHNMTTLQFLHPQKQLRIANETRNVFIPLASRMGMNQVRRELEDLCLLYTDPQEHRKIIGQLDHRRDRETETLRKCKTKLYRKFLSNDFRARIDMVFWPVSAFCKNNGSNGAKIDPARQTGMLEIICADENSCYKALSLAHTVFRSLPNTVIDSIHFPDDNLHRSLISMVADGRGHNVRLRIVSEEMKWTNELGVATYIASRNALTRTDFLEARINEIQDEIESLQDSHKKDKQLFWQMLTQDLFARHILIVTPNGDRKEMPADSTALDFAYKIHSDIGDSFDGAVVNGRKVEMGCRLKHLDMVRIKTSPEASPKLEWLDHVITPNARHKIKQALRSAPRERAIEEGKRALQKAIAPLGYHRVGFYVNQKEEISRPVLALTGYKSTDDLLAAVGTGALEIKSLLQKLKENIRDWSRDDKDLARNIFARHASFQRAYPAHIVGTDKNIVSVTRCETCLPLPGEPLVGVVSVNRKMQIHTSDCRRARASFMTGKRKAEAAWTVEAGDFLYPARLRVVGLHRPNFKEDLIQFISEQGATVSDSHSEFMHIGEQEQAEFLVEVNSHGQLKVLLEALFGLDYVLKTEQV